MFKKFLHLSLCTMFHCRHQDRFIMESLVNCDYLEEEFPSPQLRAGSAGQRAEDRLLVQVAY